MEIPSRAVLVRCLGRLDRSPLPPLERVDLELELIRLRARAELHEQLVRLVPAPDSAIRLRVL